MIPGPNTRYYAIIGLREGRKDLVEISTHKEIFDVEIIAPAMKVTGLDNIEEALDFKYSKLELKCVANC